jgi:hypothetical protein
LVLEYDEDSAAHPDAADEIPTSNVPDESDDDDGDSEQEIADTSSEND